jgi:hypothetical protein
MVKLAEEEGQSIDHKQGYLPELELVKADGGYHQVLVFKPVDEKWKADEAHIRASTGELGERTRRGEA